MVGAQARMTAEEKLNIFLKEKSRLHALAYRYLGERAEAEDAVQDAWIKFEAAQDVETPTHYLAKVVTNLCLDRLKSARARRETYVGQWLPEPLIEGPTDNTLRAAENAIDISYAVMRSLERLTPQEQAALFLHDLFDLSFDEIAQALGLPAANCRQLASRARRAITQEKQRFSPSEAKVIEIVTAFKRARESGDERIIQQLLARNVEVVSDGGGKANAARNVIEGRDNVSKFLSGILKPSLGDMFADVRIHTINGAPAVCIYALGKLQQTSSFSVDENGAITGIYIIRNPDKLPN